MAVTPWAGASGFGGIDYGAQGFDRWDALDLMMNKGPDYTGWVPRGDDVVSFKVIDPPDDRYIPGYSIVEADGDKKTVGPRLKDLNIPFSLYGLPIPITFGVRRLYGNIIWAIPLRENIKKSKKGGSGGPTTKTTEYQYFATYAVAFGVPGNTDTLKRDVLRVWADGSLIYDRRGTGQTKIQGFNFAFYKGDPTQEPDPIMEAKEGVGNVPAFRDFMYMVINDLPVAPWGNRPPAISVEIGDATESVHTVTNIETTTDVASLKTSTFGFANWDRMLYYSVYVSGSNQQCTIRTYNMASGQLINTSYMNKDEGVGWLDNNSAHNTSAYLAHVLGAQATVVTDGSMTYIPWLDVIVAMPKGGLGRGPVMLIDPLTGVATNWVGAKIGFTGAHAYPANTVLITDLPDLQHYQGTINYPKLYSPQIVYGLYDTDTYIFCQSFYSGIGIAILKLDGRHGWLDICNIEVGPNYEQFVPGTIGYGFSDMMAIQGNVIYKYRIATGAGRTGSTITGFTKSTWKDMGSGIKTMYYYAYEDAYIVFMDNGLCYKLDVDGNILFTVDATGKIPPAHLPNNHLDDLSNGYLSYQSADNGATYELDLTFGILNTFTDTTGNYAVMNTTRRFSSKMRAFAGLGLVTNHGGHGTGKTESEQYDCSLFYYDRLGDARMPLADFITGMALYAGYDISEIYVDPNIDDMIDGALISQITSYRAVINAISVLYRIDVIESDGQVKFLRKAYGYSSTDFDVAAGETLLPSTDPTSVSFTYRREEEIAVPQRVLLRYLDKALSYNWSMQMATRSQHITTNGSDEQITYEVPIAMTSSEAKNLANQALWTAWSSRVSFDFRLSPKFLKIEPGDVGSVVVGDLTYTVKATEVTYNNDYSVGIRGTSFQSDEAVDYTGDGGGGYNQDIPFDLGGDLYIIDAPLIKAGHDIAYTSQFGLYMHISPILVTTSWLGASAYTAFGEESFTEKVANTNEGLVMVAKDVPTVPSTLAQTDTLHTITVVVKAGDPSLLTSVSELDMLKGENLVAYGVNGRWEYLQFQTATDNGDGSYTLSNLLRARNGTDYAVDSHKPGDFLVLISDGITDMVPTPYTDLEEFMRYKAVGPSQTESAITPKTTQLHGYAALPWPPTNIQIARDIDAATGDITISWDRRTRKVVPLVDGTSTVALDTTELNNYLVTVTRWPYYSWAFSGGSWHPTLVTGETVTFEVTGATTLTLTASDIRTALLYEFPVPDNMSSSGSTFTNQPGSYITANATENLQIVDLGYDDFVAFKYLDVMVQQATTLTQSSSGYGPGRMTRVTIADT